MYQYQSIDQPGKVAELVVNWTEKMNIFLSPFASENLVSRDRLGRSVLRLMYQPGKATKPSRGQLNRENEVSSQRMHPW